MAIAKELEALTRVRLTNKEIAKIALEEGDNTYYACEAVANAQLKRFREWLKNEVLEDCHDGYSNVMCFHKRALKELLEEVKE